MAAEVKKTKSRFVLYLLLGLVILSSIGVIYFALFYAHPCTSYACFSEAMASCQKATYIQDTPESTWSYLIVGATNDDSCEIEVKLLMAKKSPLGFDRFQGYTMVCAYPLGFATYPEQDLSRCHGRLKEELQQVIITKLHTYILQNFGNLTNTLESLETLKSLNQSIS